MAASSPLVGQSPITPRPAPHARGNAMPVPASWRALQGVLLFGVLLLALFFNARGYLSVPPARSDSRTFTDQIGFFVLAGLILLATPTVATIAASTFQEAVRRRWMLALIGISVLVLALASNSSTPQPGSENNFLRDFGIGYIIAITLLMAIFLGVALVPPEVERRTVLTILAKPVNRLEFLLGKFLGLCFTLGFVLLVLGGVFLLAYAIFNIRSNVDGLQGALKSEYGLRTSLTFDLMNLGNALLLHFGQLCVLGALALMLSLIVSPITAITFCFIAYFGGQMSSYWGELASGSRTATENAGGISKGVQGVISVLYYALPRLDTFDVRNQLVTDTPVQFNYVWKAFGSGLLYVGVLLVIGYLVFSDREF